MTGSNVMRFFTGNSEGARLDASGNLLVGKTSASFTTAGLELRNGGPAIFGRSQAEPLILNRLTTDGGIVNFNKDGTTVGSIGSVSSGVAGISFVNPTYGGIRTADYRINPVNGSGVNFDNSIDLGAGGTRWKDLYLSGGVYLGGTGSANKLDDYEEGTFTPVLKRDGSTNNATITVSGAVYVKIGRMVHVSFYLSAIDYSAVTDGTAAIITGLPFTATSATWFSGNIGYGTSTNASYTTWVVSGSNGYFLNSNNNGFRSGTVDLNRGMFTITYQTI